MHLHVSSPTALSHIQLIFQSSPDPSWYRADWPPGPPPSPSYTERGNPPPLQRSEGGSGGPLTSLGGCERVRVCHATTTGEPQQGDDEEREGG